MDSFLPLSQDTSFTMEHLPYGVFSHKNSLEQSVCVAIGDYILDLSVLEKRGLFPEACGEFSQATLNSFIRRGKDFWHRTRTTLQELLSAKNPILRDDKKLQQSCLLLQKDVRLYLPLEIGDYTDFYASKEHATNIGTMFRDKDNPLLPNWLHLPVGYHGRASSIVVSNTPFQRPCGQIKNDKDPAPFFGPSQRLDFELELAFVIARDSELGKLIHVDDAEDFIFGVTLLNDWSARDIQKWEYVPLGPFGSKNFATTISPWITPLAALEDFRVEGPVQDPTPLPYLRQKRKDSHFDMKLEVELKNKDGEKLTISRSNSKYLYWSMAQKLCHHTITGCNVRVGDLLASGTISGPEKDSYGSLIELTWGGQNPIRFPSGATRTFLQDYDTITLRGFCEKNGKRLALGEVSGTVLPALLTQL